MRELKLQILKFFNEIFMLLEFIFVGKEILFNIENYIIRLTNPEEATSIANALLAAFSQRIEWILQRSLNVTAKPYNMDEIEKRIFKIGQETERCMKNWIRGVERQSLKRKHL